MLAKARIDFSFEKQLVVLFPTIIRSSSMKNNSFMYNRTRISYEYINGNLIRLGFLRGSCFDHERAGKSDLVNKKLGCWPRLYFIS